MGSSRFANEIKRKLMIITPSVSGGSWIFLHHLLDKLPINYKTTVVSLGKIDAKYRIDRDKKFFGIPYLNYEKHGIFIASIPILNLLFELPLLIISSLLILIHRPRIIIVNGFMAGLGTLASVKMVNSRIVVSHRGYLGSEMGGFRRRMLRSLGKYFDCILVNSEGSKADVTSILDKNIFDESKIVVVKHMADDIFFETHNRCKLKTDLKFFDKFVVLYVGRIDSEKRTDLLISVIEALKNNPEMLFIFVGPGNLVPQVRSLEEAQINVKYLGQIYDRTTLSDLYAAADLVWSYADDTYLARPAVEALASGTPIIIPDEVALLLKKSKVPAYLVPSSIGWLVQPNAEAIASKIMEIEQSHAAETMRINCRSYALENYSKNNLRVALDKLEDVIEM